MRLAANNLAAGADTLVHTIPVGKKCVFSVNFCNRTGGSAKVRLALTSGGAPAATDWIEYDATVAANGVLLRTALALGAGQKVYARSDIADVTVMVFGIEGAA